MKTGLLATLAISGLLATGLNVLAAQPPKMKMTTDIPASITTPDKVKTSIGTLEFFDGVPTRTPLTRSMIMSIGHVPRKCSSI